MRIDVFFDVYPHPAKPYFESQLAEWRRQGHELRLFSFGAIRGASSEFPITFIHTLRNRPLYLALAILWRCLTNPARCWRAFQSEDRLMQRIKTLVIDAQLPGRAPDVHFVHNLATAVWASYLKRALPDTKLAVYYHGGEIPGVRQIPYQDSYRALQRADIVFSNTRASIKEAESRGARPDRTVCMPVGIPLERFVQPDEREYLKDNCWHFVCVGRMAREKGFDIALNAFAALRRRTTAFNVTLIGDGPELETLKKLTIELRLQDAVHFLGHVEFHKLIPLFSGFDALVLSSTPIYGSTWTETQATVMQEAMLMGTIVVASDIGGVRESLPPTLHSYLSAPGSAAALTECLASVMKHSRDDLRTLGRMARQFVEERYDIRKINEEILSIIPTISS